MRLLDWQDRFRALIDHYHSVPWEWGKTDCACFARDTIGALTGRCVGADWIGDYFSQYTAAAALLRRGHDGLESALAAELAAAGFPEIAPERAVCGDIGLTPDGAAVVVRLPNGFAGRRMVGGVPFFMKSPATRAWQIG